MSSAASRIELLPNELLDEIISLLPTSPPPSSNRLHQPPSVHITRSQNRWLKNLSQTCSRFRDLVRPWLFTHSCVELKDVDEYLEFISRSDLDRYVTSIVMKAYDASDNLEDPLGWRRILRSVNPLRLVVIAPPAFIGEMLGNQICTEHSWAFEISLQVLRLECDRRPCRPALASEIKEQGNLLDCRPWSSMQFNESSSLKAYNHYEYFLFRVPSIFYKWGSLSAPNAAQLERSQLSLSLKNLTSFTYVAVFPFYNHTQLVIDTVHLMTNLRSLTIQLGPSKDDRVTEIEQRGSMDPSDPWMELGTGYFLIAHAVWNLGEKSWLSKFTTRDFEIDAVRVEIATTLGEVLKDPWAHDGYGTWTKRPAEIAALEGNPTTTVNNIA